MENKTKHDAMVEFFKEKTKDLATKILGFNFSEEREGGISFVTNYSDKVRKRYIRRGAEKEYGFSIIITKSYSTNVDNVNLEAMNFAQKFMEWVEAQDKAKNYPQFPENCEIRGMENLQNMPNLASINREAGLARYMIQCKLIYFEQEEKR